MKPPDESFSGDIDLFRVRQEPPKLPDPSFPPAAYVLLHHRPQRYHSMRLALVIGLFASGGLICSMLLVDGGDDFPRPRYWPWKSSSSPALPTPQRPAAAPAVPQKGPLKSSGDKNAALQEHRVADRKPSTASPLVRIRYSKFRFAPLIVLGTKWVNFAGNFRDHRITFDFARDLAFGFRRGSR